MVGSSLQYITIFISFVTLDIVILEMSWSSAWYVTTLPSLVIIGIVVVKMFLVCHVIFQNHFIKRSYDYIDKGPLNVSHQPVTYDVHRNCGSKI